MHTFFALDKSFRGDQNLDPSWHFFGFLRTCHHPIREGIDQKLKYRQKPYKMKDWKKCHNSNVLQSILDKKSSRIISTRSVVLDRFQNVLMVKWRKTYFPPPPVCRAEILKKFIGKNVPENCTLFFGKKRFFPSKTVWNLSRTTDLVETIREQFFIQNWLQNVRAMTFFSTLHFIWFLLIS